jgi:hypothetical protein
MLPKPAPGVKGLASMDNIMISAWYAKVREVCWWHSLPTSVRIVVERGYRLQVNIRIDAKYAEVQAGHTYLKPDPLIYECWYAS